MNILQRTTLLVVVTGLVGALGCRGWETDKPPVHLNWNMDTQQRGQSYRQSELFADGRAMRTPPAGTVAQGYLHEDDMRSYGTVTNAAGTKPGNVWAGGDVDVVRGQNRFGIYCSPCHGLSGDGDGVVNSRLGVKAPSFHDVRLKEMAVGQMYRAILLGVNGGNMGSYAGQLTEQDRWNVLAYVRALQKSRDANVTLGGKEFPDPVPEPTDPTAKFGESLYVSKGCNACHTLDGNRTVGPTWKGMYGRVEKVNGADVTVDDAYIAESIASPMAKVVDTYPPAMPPMALKDIELKSLILFMQTLK